MRWLMEQICSIFSFGRWASRSSANTAFIRADYGASILRRFQSDSPSKSKAAYLPGVVTYAEPASLVTARNTPSSPSSAGGSSVSPPTRSETAWLWDGLNGRFNRIDWEE